MNRRFTLFLLLFILVFLIAAPAVIAKGVQRDIYSIRREEKAGRFRGRLTLWQITDTKTGAKTASSFLGDRIRAFEKSNPKVFMDLVSLGVAEAEQRLAAGDAPDLVSYPLGFFASEEAFYPLNKPKALLPAYRKCTAAALPYMAQSYQLLCNQELFSQAALPLPIGGEFSYEHLVLALSTFAKSGDAPVLTLDHAQCTKPALSLLWLKFPADGDFFEQDLPIGEPLSSFRIAAGLSDFISEKAPMCLAPQSRSYELSSTQKPASLAVYPASYYSDLVQCIGVFRQENEKETQMCAEFAQSLLLEPAQRGVCSLLMFPVVSLENSFPRDAQLAEEAATLGRDGVIPIGTRLKAESEAIDEAAARALAGDDTATGTLIHLIS